MHAPGSRDPDREWFSAVNAYLQVGCEALADPGRYAVFGARRERPQAVVFPVSRPVSFVDNLWINGGG
jgi:hypothetical protein